MNFITYQDVRNSSLILSDKGEKLYDVLILSHQEYVTQREYDNLKKIVANGGILILLDGKVFYAEVAYDPTIDKITLEKAIIGDSMVNPLGIVFRKDGKMKLPGYVAITCVVK